MAEQVTQWAEDFLLQGIHIRAQRAEALPHTGLKEGVEAGEARTRRLRPQPHYDGTEKA